MQHRGRMGGFGICRSLIRSTAIALKVLKKTSRPARATTISWTPPRPMVIPECRRVRPASIKPRVSVNAGLTGIRTTPLRRRAGLSVPIDRQSPAVTSESDGVGCLQEIV